MGFGVVAGALCLVALLAGAPASIRAQQAAAGPAAQEFGATAVVPNDPERERQAEGRSVVTRRQLQLRMPRSAPEALQYEPGVYVQKTAHGQASPYLRGMTGQQVVHLFDGVRMNNGVYRQGPNQYFFSVDAETLEALEVVRGSASVRHGSDALGGAIMALPRAAFVDGDEQDITVHPRLTTTYGSVDTTAGARGEIETQLSPTTGLLVGGGYRDVGQLESGGVVFNPGMQRPMVPRFEADGRTQKGTGYSEATFDAHMTQALVGKLRLVAAVYGYRQFDAPRTDQCPPIEAPESECLWVDEQYRTLGYVSLRGDAGRSMRDIELTASVQRHHERRRRDRPRSFVEHLWRNDVTTLGASFSAATRELALGDQAKLKLRYGADAYRDEVASEAWQRFTDLDLTFARNRGQYIDGSTYLSTGLFAEAQLSPWPWMTVRGGGRAAAVGARAAGDEASATVGVHREWTAVVGRAGLDVRPAEQVQISLNADQGFRAPNLDDLTARQQAGPGFQFENAALTPERTTTFEAGLIAGPAWLQLDVWAFATLLDDGIVRAVREGCPPQTPGCDGSWSQLQPVNADEGTTILGTEGSVQSHLPGRLTLRTTYSYAWGEAPNTGSTQTAGRDAFGARVPLSRVPPFNGTVELGWSHLPSTLDLSGALRWALAQRRLAPSDLADARIPVGGTPGYAVLDLRAGYRPSEWLALRLVFENVFDAAYRVHGSSVNGGGRGVLVSATVQG